MIKDSDPGVLLEAIRKVGGGGKFIDPVLVDSVVSDISDVRVNENRQLTDREFQVLQHSGADPPCHSARSGARISRSSCPLR